jgi:adenine-specific DNA-methyltransferase
MVIKMQLKDSVMMRKPQIEEPGYAFPFADLCHHEILQCDVMKSAALIESVDYFRVDASRKLDPERRSDLGQFLTPLPTARLMASMLEAEADHIRLLDPGAGVGSLTAATISEICGRRKKPKSIHVTAYEIDAILLDYLEDTLKQCGRTCEKSGIQFDFDLKAQDFITKGVQELREALFKPLKEYNCAILNPPYRKIHSDSDARSSLREIDVEASNLYTAFLAVTLKLLAPYGEMVAITPRSFCNGLYFKSFRKFFLEALSVQRVHVFDSRQIAFKEDDVLQENIIIQGIKRGVQRDITISSSSGPEDDLISFRKIHYSQFVHQNDPEFFMHIAPDELNASVADRLKGLKATLGDLGIEVSTGRVVDFRATEFLHAKPVPGTVPLIYPLNFEKGFLRWPKEGRKPQAISFHPATQDLLVPEGMYVLTKRFSAKEENRRVVAALYDPRLVPAANVGFENHINYFHMRGKGLPPLLAKGLAVFLNSTFVDMAFRQFSGHTQVNATDLRNMRYPIAEQLEMLGQYVGTEFPSQEMIDHAVEEVLSLAPADETPLQARKKIDEALEILKAIGLPRGQLNDRSALSLLALLDLKPGDSWRDAKSPLMGITQMMMFFENRYGKRYALNTRESVRRLTIHQFLDASIVSINPDEPERPTNSGKTVYQIEPGLLKLVRSFGSDEWEKGLTTYLASVETLRQKYAQERQMKRIPIKIGEKTTITLSPGGQNVLIKEIIENFCPVFASGGKLIYIGDTEAKFAYFDKSFLISLGVFIEEHGKMPDVVVYVEDKNWLFFIEAVTSHGPINPKRHNELKKLFQNSTAGLVFVTAFLDRRSMLKYLGEISWETEVWVADSPTHLIHFNGERFLGPHEG